MEFKVGDKVIVKRVWIGDIFSEVIEVTATAGNVRVKGVKGLFNKEGYLKPARFKNTQIRHIDNEEYDRKIYESEVLTQSREIAQYLSRLETIPSDGITNIIKKLHKAINGVESEKPTVHFNANGESGNIFYIMARVSEVLSDSKELEELWAVVKEGTYSEAIAAIRERINLIDDAGIY